MRGLPYGRDHLGNIAITFAQHGPAPPSVHVLEMDIADAISMRRKCIVDRLPTSQDMAGVGNPSYPEIQQRENPVVVRTAE